MAADVEVKIQGLDQLKARLGELSTAMKRRHLRTWLAAGARLVRDEAKRNAPVLSAQAKAPYRQPRTLQQAIRVRTSKSARRDGNVGVFVNVKPLRPGGAKNPRDPYYWRFQEFGWNPARRGESKRERRALVKAGTAKRVPGRRFLTQAAQAKLPAALQAFEQRAAKWLAEVDRTGRPGA